MQAAERAPAVQPVPTNGHNLKRLGAVEKTVQYAESSYETVKSKLPPSVRPTLEQAEAAAAPYVNKAADAGASLLRVADEKVDAAINTAAEKLEKNQQFLAQQVERQKQFHSQNLESYKQAREAYLRKVEEAVEYIKAKGVSGAAKDAADEVAALVAAARAQLLALPGALFARVQAAVDNLLAFGPVSSAVDAAKPRLAAARDGYLHYHDQLVASRRYRALYDQAAALATRAQQTWLYNRALQSVPQPAVDTATPYINSLVAHLQPASA